jgi:Zn/Cd-binding protein ZinT
LYALVIGVLVTGLSGCASAPRGGTSALDAWAGTWNNFYSYFERPALSRAYAVLAEKEGKTPEEIKKRYIEGQTYRCEIAAMGITGNEIRFYNASQCSANATDGVVYKGTYRDMGDVDINGRVWRYFQTSAGIPYVHLLLLPAEADEPGKTMKHFHFRYGKDLETIKNAEGWYATMTLYDSTDDLLIGHMTH